MKYKFRQDLEREQKEELDWGLVEAADKGDLLKLHQLTRDGANPNAYNGEALYRAVANRNFPAVFFLLSRGAIPMGALSQKDLDKLD